MRASPPCSARMTFRTARCAHLDWNNGISPDDIQDCQVGAATVEHRDSVKQYTVKKQGTLRWARRWDIQYFCDWDANL